jgi:hypothetical protein
LSDFRTAYKETAAMWLLQKLEAYYGRYDAAIGAVVVQYLHSKGMSREQLGYVFSEVVQEISSQYKTPPDVAQLKPIVLRVQEQYATRKPAELPEPEDPEAQEDGAKLLRATLESLQRGDDPRMNSTVQEILDRHGQEDV